MLTTVVLAAAFAAGVTGAWSPCGFSMVETLAPSGYAQRLRTTAIACATFAAGALAGGVITFGGLALLGDRLGANAPVRGGDRRARRRGRRGPQRPHRPAGPPPGAGVLAPRAAGPARRRAVRRPARARLHHLHPHLRRLGAGRGQRRRPGDRPADRARVRRGPGAAGDRARPERRRPRCTPRWPSARGSCARCACSTPRRSRSPPRRSRPRRRTPPRRSFAVGSADPSIDGATIALHRPGGAGELRNWRTLPGNHPAVGGGRLAYIAGATIAGRGRPRDRRARSRRARGLGDLGGVARRTARCTPRPWPTGFARLVIAGGVGRPVLRDGLLVFDIDGRIEAIDLNTGRARAAAPRGRRAAARPVGARLPADLHPGDLQAPAGADRRPAAAPHRRRPHALRHDPHRPPRRGPRARARPRPRPHQRSHCGSARRRASPTR